MSEKPTPGQYAKRDAAFEDHFAQYLKTKSGQSPIAILRAAFNAGWEARKRAEYETIVEYARAGVKPNG